MNCQRKGCSHEAQGHVLIHLSHVPKTRHSQDHLKIYLCDEHEDVLGPYAKYRPYL